MLDFKVDLASKNNWSETAESDSYKILLLRHVDVVFRRSSRGQTFYEYLQQEKLSCQCDSKAGFLLCEQYLKIYFAIKVRCVTRSRLILRSFSKPGYGYTKYTVIALYTHIWHDFKVCHQEYNRVLLTIYESESVLSFCTYLFYITAKYLWKQ